MCTTQQNVGSNFYYLIGKTVAIQDLLEKLLQK